MVPRPTFLCRLLLASAVLGMATARAQLASRSPFQPVGAGANTPTADAPLEFGGYLDTPGEGRLYRISMKDPARKAAVWVKLNERNPDLDVIVKQHDDDQQTLTIEHGGKTLTLAEKKSKIVSAGSAAQVMPPPVQMAMPNVPPAVTQAVVLNPTPADEQRRLEAVAAEVARRRALREQAAHQQANPQPMPVQPPRTMPNTRPQR